MEEDYMASETQMEELIHATEHLSEIDTLYYFLDLFASEIAFASSLGGEDQVLTDLIASRSTQAEIFTLDTGRLPQETYVLIDKTNSHYNIKLRVYYPQTKAVEALVSKKGVFSFYESIENRKECCTIRKLEPLSRALTGHKAWITGLRRAQSVTREHMKMIEWDATHKLIKLNPLIDWTEKMVWDYIKLHKVPYNSLHDKGYASIGCAPCTRAVKKGDDIRSGRWWWETPEHKECGIHARK